MDDVHQVLQAFVRWVNDSLRIINVDVDVLGLGGKRELQNERFLPSVRIEPTTPGLKSRRLILLITRSATNTRIKVNVLLVLLVFIC